MNGYVNMPVAPVDAKRIYIPFDRMELQDRAPRQRQWFDAEIISGYNKIFQKGGG
jgi:hypothetical protein